MTTRRYEQRLRAEAAEETRQRILDAVHQRLREAPSQPVSVDLVARMAGVARSTVYLIFGSRAGLFEAFGADLWRRTGLGRLGEAVAVDDAREHLRGGIRAGIRMFAEERDVYRALFSMAALDSDAVGGIVATMERDRAGGTEHLAARLADQGQLRPDVTVEQAAQLLWLLTSFDGYDLLATGRGMSCEQIVDLVTVTAERALCR